VNDVEPVPRIPGGRVADRLRAAMAHWQHEVVALGSIDPVTTELVRLRAADHHDCHT
jgi:alkylhydroperoxidase family enzyme